jgi:hypothetical protein
VWGGGVPRIIIGDIAAVSRLAKLERDAIGRAAADDQLSNVGRAMM